MLEWFTNKGLQVCLTAAQVEPGKYICASAAGLVGKTSKRKSPQCIICSCPDHCSQLALQFDLLNKHLIFMPSVLFLMYPLRFFLFPCFKRTKNKRTQINKAYICKMHADCVYCSVLNQYCRNTHIIAIVVPLLLF